MRPVRLTDAPALFRLVEENRHRLRQWMPWVDKTRTEEDSVAFIESHEQAARDQSGSVLVIVCKDRVKGCIGMHGWNHETNICSVGYWIAGDMEGTGTMLQCATAFVDFIFSKLNMNKIEIHFLPGNEKSQRLAQRLGAKVEGVIRQCKMLNGNLHDLVITGILRSEWKQ